MHVSCGTTFLKRCFDEGMGQFTVLVVGFNHRTVQNPQKNSTKSSGAISESPFELKRLNVTTEMTLQSSQW